MANENAPPMGFLAVEVNIARPPGDPFNEQTWSFPLIRETVSGSSVADIVTDKQYGDEFIERFVAAGIKLAERGAVGIMTSCGFLAMAQKKLSARLPIPIATSSLIQIPTLRAIINHTHKIGLLTYDASRLTDRHLTELGIDPASVHIFGAPPRGYLRGYVSRGDPYDSENVEQELITMAKQLLHSAQDKIGAIVLECTNMAPHGESIHRATGLPVYDVYTLGEWFYSGLNRKNPSYWAMRKPRDQKV
ncbi:hypothetical protein N7456_005611 [Penicillium angulare]|uniref:Aspartate/glutamate racemase family protein n=1 Tax=Penicillium angulare TaxID=116970 RepID=A0A9W9FYV3_9EURO|nr:hypothetical protein N7456_005611 [Penicillium angulare]